MNGHWKAKRIKYDEGTTVPKYRDIGLAIVCYDSINTLFQRIQSHTFIGTFHTPLGYETNRRDSL